jgi:hypothetical protein
VLALAGLAALFGSCGGGDGEETGILAVAFRLDGESPLITAYFGDPTENPLQLPAGRYYIEALDQDDLAISLGAVDIEEGDVVDFPPSFDAAGGSVDAERAESLKAVASFLIDVELSELVFLKAVTGGFTELPFDPAVEPDAASVQELFEIYAEIAAQEDAIEAALSQIDDRAEVSLGVLYVRSPWAPAPGLTDLLKKKLNDWLFEDDGLLSWMKRATGEGKRESILQIAEQIPEQDRESVFNGTPTRLTGNAHDFDSWVEEIKQGNLDHELSAIYGELYSADPEAAARAKQRPIDVHAREGAEGVKHGAKKLLETYKKVPVVGKLIDTTEKALEWEEYAKKLAKDLGGTLDESARAHIRKQIEEKIKSDLKEHAANLPSLTDTGIDKLAEYFAKKAVGALPKPPSSLTPTVAAPTATQAVPTPKATPKATPKVTPDVTPSASPAPSASPSPTAEVTPDTGWIEGYVQGIAGQWLDKGYGGIDVAMATDDLRQCLTASVLAGTSQNQAKADCPPWLYEPSLPEETPSPEPSPSPSAPPSPAQMPTPSPTAEGREVTAVGQYLRPEAEGYVALTNTMELTFNTGGGSVKGEGHKDIQTPDDDGCGTGMIYATFNYEGTYSPDTKTFSGTLKIEAGGYSMLEYCDLVGDEWLCECESVPWGDSFSGDWQATLEDGVVKGSQTVEVDTFELTVQG